MSHSVFLQTPRHYTDYTYALRNLMYSSVDVERFLQRSDSSISLFPVCMDGELVSTGHQNGKKRLIGFNYNLLHGIEHFAAYSLIFNVAKKFNAHYYFDGYEIHWGATDYRNFVMVSKHKAMEGRSREGQEHQKWLYEICDKHILELFK